MKTVTSQAIVAILVLTSCLTINCQAQTSVDNKRLVMPVNDTAVVAIHNQKAQRFLFEFIAGPSLCMLYGRPIEGKVPFLRYTISLGASYQLSKNVDLDAKLLWEAKGSRKQFWDIAYTDNTRAEIKQGNEFDYLTLSLGLSYYVDCDRRLFVTGGVGLSYLADSHGYSHYYGEDGKLLYTIRTADSQFFKTFDVGLTTLIGYRRYLTKRMKASIQLFGNLGMTHAYKESAHHLKPMRNANLGLLVGVGIPSQ